MKKAIIFLAITTLVLNASAQIKRTKPIKAAIDSTTNVAAPIAENTDGQRSRKEKRELFKQLDLTRPQMKQLKEMRKDAKVKKDEIEANTKLTDEERKQQTRAIKIEQLKKLQQILTPDQLAKLKKLKKENAGAKMEMDDLDL